MAIGRTLGWSRIIIFDTLIDDVSQSMTGRKQLPKIWVQAGNALGLSLARVTAADTSRFRLREGKDPWHRGPDHRMGEMSPASLLSVPCVAVWLSRFAGGTAGLVRRQAMVTAHDE